MRNWIGLLCGVVAVVILLIPTGNTDVSDTKESQLVSNSFDIYEKLWRAHALAAADKLAAGEFTEDTEVWNYLAAGQAPARKAAFMDIAKYEQDQFDSNDGWSAELHEKILRSYADER